MKDKGPAPAGFYGGIGFFGNYDMAGNVREWCWNEIADGRALMGGAWNDVTYVYLGVTKAPSFDRSLKNGFRCVRYTDKNKLPEEAFQPYTLDERRDFYKEEPVSEEVFEIYKKQFAYDDTELDAEIEYRDN